MDRRTFLSALAMSVGSPATRIVPKPGHEFALHVIERRAAYTAETMHRRLCVVGIGREGHRMLNSPESRTLDGNITLVQAWALNPLVPWRTVSIGEETTQVTSAVNEPQLVFLVGDFADAGSVRTAGAVAHAARAAGALVVGIIVEPAKFDIGRCSIDGLCEGLTMAGVDAILRPASCQGRGHHSKVDLPVQHAWAVVIDSSHLVLAPPFDRLTCMDIRSVLNHRGYVPIGIGTASGTGRARIAAARAMEALMPRSFEHCGAEALAIIVTGSPSLQHKEISSAFTIVESFVGQHANITRGVRHDTSLGDRLRVTVLIAGSSH
jgi:FtsZ family, C-terminal domain